MAGGQDLSTSLEMTHLWRVPIPSGTQWSNENRPDWAGIGPWPLDAEAFLNVFVAAQNHEGHTGVQHGIG